MRLSRVAGEGAGERRGFVYVSFVFLGISTTVFLHSMRKDLQEYNLTITELQFFQIVPFLPWCYKCFFALFSEKVPIRNQHQRPYLIIANFVSAILCFFLLLPSLNKGEYLFLFFLQQNFAAWADCILDTMKVEEATDESRGDAALSGRFGTRTQIARTLGRWIGRTSGPLLWESMTSKGVYGLLSVSYLIPMILSCFVPEKQKLFQRRRRLKTSFGQPGDGDETGVFCLGTLRVLWKYMQNRSLVIILLFVLGTGLFIPTPATPVFFFLNDVVGLSSAEQSLLNFTSELSQLLALLVFDKWIRKWTISTMYMSFALLQSVTIVFTMLIVVEVPGTNCPRLVEVNDTMVMTNTTCYFYETNGIKPFPLALGESIIGDALDELQSLPLNVATSQVCTGQLSGTMFTLMYALQNIIGVIASVFNAQWISVLGIDHYKFQNLYILILVGGGGWLLALLLAYIFIPRVTFAEVAGGGEDVVTGHHFLSQPHPPLDPTSHASVVSASNQSLDGHPHGGASISPETDQTSSSASVLL
jgi:hypothetical protein